MKVEIILANVEAGNIALPALNRAGFAGDSIS